MLLYVAMAVLAPRFGPLEPLQRGTDGSTAAAGLDSAAIGNIF